MLEPMPGADSADPYAGRDARTRLIDESRSFERLEPAARWVLLAVGFATLSMGIHSWLTGLN